MASSAKPTRAPASAPMFIAALLNTKHPAIRPPKMPKPEATPSATAVWAIILAMCGPFVTFSAAHAAAVVAPINRHDLPCQEHSLKIVWRAETDRRGDDRRSCNAPARRRSNRWRSCAPGAPTLIDPGPLAVQNHGTAIGYYVKTVINGSSWNRGGTAVEPSIH